MKNNGYLYVVRNTRNELRTEADFELLGRQFNNVDVKIDTGCPRTSIPIKRLGISDYDAYQLKDADCKDKRIKKNVSFGVNDSTSRRNEDRRKFSNKQYMDLDSISFRHSMKTLDLGGLQVGDVEVSVSYDRTGNILIGMDILELLEAHIGEDVSGNIVFIACNKSVNCPEFDKKLESLFSLKRIV